MAMAAPPLRSSYGLHQPYALRNIVEIESVDGITGIAETYGGENPRTALEKLREQILGADALRLLGDLQPLVHGEGGGSERSQVNLVPGENPLDTYRNRLPRPSRKVCRQTCVRPHRWTRPRKSLLLRLPLLQTCWRRR